MISNNHHFVRNLKAYQQKNIIIRSTRVKRVSLSVGVYLIGTLHLGYVSINRSDINGLHTGVSSKEIITYYTSIIRILVLFNI